ncbi:4-diphosphocytidyl-2-C-methyl-D-erythritol kinase [Octadecabacter temperatus]|uniref:4-diphosphocytidyl-2-C-methyl-D-erythritol kinase n=1 Tax=Octadecabacter temperatus TaxID=1458307 RepID=A0A0K0Y912_9RHOB|nr:4-(cytidine 5'-diphospho)-2-C-methyl-D-erythritol kinase [Octadecabacter temperatus]AKS47454.1 4-diphosphocytidyl-2-C-methyl-D-erythritol kinase [Octadecabacter temperatus]SIO42532.1 4-diphosphocytidyl-2-C-methyl-D-erythritol kinase [Octadecabacter temperatus]
MTNGTIVENAFAKINLSLHVTGLRADGYHLLDSLVMFTSLGDTVHVAPAETLSLTIEGPFATDLDVDDNNLVLRAARSFGVPNGAAITLHKNLPVASGIGGGSADAAATLRALSRLWDIPIPDAETILALGADVPVCMTSELTRMRGIGDELEKLGPAPMLDIVLVNPNVGVSTATVFNGLGSKSNASMSNDMPDPFDIDEWIDWLARQRNDLQTPALAAAPVINDVLAALSAQRGCELARMSGSGATCFALFEDSDAQDAAVKALRLAHPEWWVAKTDEAPT